MHREPTKEDILEAKRFEDGPEPSKSYMAVIWLGIGLSVLAIVLAILSLVS
jgi:hypothetical protein